MQRHLYLAVLVFCKIKRQHGIPVGGYKEDPVVVDGNVVTSRGVGTAIAFALKLIEVLISKEKAEEIAASIIYSA